MGAKMNFDAINDRTGFAQGCKFLSKQEVREYFTAANIRSMYGQNDLTQETLTEMADAVIENKWHCEF